MTFHISVVREEDHPFAIRRGVRKPIVRIVGGHAFLIGAVGMHAPDLHGAGTLRIEIDVLAIWRIVRSVVQAFGRGQANFFSAGSGNAENIEVAISFTDKGERLAIRRPSVPIRRAVPSNCNSVWSTTGDR